MFRRLVASLLIVALIGYGTAWAFAGHALDDADHAAGGVHEHTQAARDGGGCDHCCHAGAHMTGLAPVIPKLPAQEADTFSPASSCIAATLATAPALKPPRS